ncbi:PIG-L deacetylase family protein [Phytopseudomonas dryadis]|uniref:Acetylglucosaminylphosphatidylinositol deacetylase n=1 Tax=Phytopseudomonas dryadis TaxID=2487520 RepID=A0A4Q9QUX3_9GAMM|nr:MULTISPECIES: PIG-L family deacetylase [Pseudomonas]TBU87108.1 acetylglucosaminylphosphatidylinositol deacetylase [Pseudomonas dryadis]TBV09485.1 acetylglucosaminylphosphatidylinositol deacetylase [Pseudomonas dryadis]TBV13398.1 acetylglucosaminylphosphatidylinositol deacetylase [Pseudomonas sp. FRB 230]
MRANPIIGSGTSLQAWNSSNHLGEVDAISCAQLVSPHARAVIVSPHPDDEILGCGGLLQLLAREQRQILLISVTDGSASHKGSRYWTPQRLSVVRPQESADALKRLGLPLNEMKWVHGGFTDTAVSDQENQLQAFLLTYLQPSDVVFTTWCEDGHGDHEAVGRASLAAARQVGATVHEIPVWTWHWASPEDPRIPWQRARKLHLDKWMLARKRHAVQAFASQLYRDPDTGQEPVLSSVTLERLLQPFEVVFL